MPYVLEDLVVTRVDLVDEGANSAAFIELYKRKEQGSKMKLEEILAKMKPEHAEVIKAAISEATDKADAAEIAKANAESTLAEKVAKEAEAAVEQEEEEEKKEETEKTDAFDEEETLKSLPEPLRDYITKMRADKEAAESELQKAKDKELQDAAIMKAKDLKALPIEENKLANVIKGGSPELLELLKGLNKAFEEGALTEIGKSTTEAFTGNAWEQIEKRAASMMKEDEKLTKEKAIAQIIKAEPKLYKQYIDEGGE